MVGIHFKDKKMKFEFVKSLSDCFPIEAVCNLCEVSKSGYYNWVNNLGKKPKHDKLLKKILRIEHDNKGTYGVNRVHKTLLRNYGIRVSRRTVQNIMHKSGIKAITGKKFKPYTKSVDPNPHIYPNILDQDFCAGHINETWLGDITYVRIGDKWHYVAAFMDLYSRKIVSWTLGNAHDAKLVTDALNIAICCENPPKGLIIHTDRGTSYTSDAFKELIEKHGFVGSMSRPGVPYDNAPMESFYHTFKGEFVNFEKFRSVEEAREKIKEWINEYYNFRRLHSSIGYIPPGICYYLNSRNLSCP